MVRVTLDSLEVRISNRAQVLVRTYGFSHGVNTRQVWLMSVIFAIYTFDSQVAEVKLGAHGLLINISIQ